VLQARLERRRIRFETNLPTSAIESIPTKVHR